MSDLKLVVALRERTGAGMVDCKNALTEANGDLDKAAEILRAKGAVKAAKKAAERTASEGVVASYVHHNKKLAVLVELLCETDFVARTDQFQALANDIAMQVAAFNPEYVSPEQVPAEIVEKQRQSFLAELAEDKKPDDVKAKIVEGKVNKWLSDICLTKQSFFKDEALTIEQLVTDKVATIGEKITIGRMVRFELAAKSGPIA